MVKIHQSFSVNVLPGPVARSDARPPGMRTVAGSILRSGNIFRGDWSWNHFYGHSFPSTDSNRAVVNYWRMDVHLVLDNRLGSLPKNSVVR